MSYEHFQTFLTADMRTAPNGRDVEYAESGTQEPRAFIYGDDLQLMFNPEVENRGRAWSACYLHSHNALELVARTVETDEMAGLTGDHPEKREQAARVIRATAELVKALAADAACDGSLTDQRWYDALLAVREASMYTEVKA